MRSVSRAAVALATAMTLFASGCTTSEGTTPRPAACGDLDSVRAALDNVQTANVSENGLQQLRADLNRLRDELTALAENADGQFQAQIDAVREAAAGLRSSVSAARANPSTAAYDAVRTAVVAVRDAVLDLGIVMNNTC